MDDAQGETSDAIVRDRELRGFCCRLFGWSAERASLVDDVVQSLLAAVARGTPIALSGESDLVPVAYALHRRILGAERPFVVCDPRRREVEGSVRAPPNRRTGLLAVEAAIGGSVCLRSNRLPADFEVFTTSFQESRRLPTIFVCLRRDDPLQNLLCPPLPIPSLDERASELDLLLDAFLDEAAETLGAKRVRLSLRMRKSVFEQVTSLGDLEKTALRLVALASARNPTQAALRLNMASVSLIRWLRRRRWSAAVLGELEAGSAGTDDRARQTGIERTDTHDADAS